MSQPDCRTCSLLTDAYSSGTKERTSSEGTGWLQAFAFCMSGGHSQQRDLGRRYSARGRGKMGGGKWFHKCPQSRRAFTISGEKESHKPWETEKGGGYPQSSQLRSAPNDSKPHNRVQHHLAHLRRRGPR